MFKLSERSKEGIYLTIIWAGICLGVAAVFQLILSYFITDKSKFEIILITSSCIGVMAGNFYIGKIMQLRLKKSKRRS